MYVSIVMFVLFFSVLLSPTNESNKLVTDTDMATSRVPVFQSDTEYRMESYYLCCVDDVL